MGIFRTDILRDRLGVWVWDTSQAPIRHTVERIKRAGFTWIAVKAQDGPQGYNLSHQQLDTWRHECESHGIHFGLWGFLYGSNPWGEADVAADLCNRHGAGFYIADAEAGYEQRPPASEIFASRFKRHHPHLPKALSTFGRIDLHPMIDYHAWRDHGFSFMPQAYVDVSPLLRPSTCVEVASRIWHPSEMAVTLEANPHLDYSGYVRDAAHHGVKGFNVWRADLASDKMLAEVHRNK